MVKLKRSLEITLESKKDLDDLKAYLGQDLFDDYMKIRDKISKDQNDFKDFQKLKKKDKKDISNFIDSFQSKSDKKKSDKTEGAEKLYEDDDWVVYKITTYPAAQLYGKGTKWCIAGRYPGHEGKGEKYFNDYIESRRLDGGYYFYLNKKNPNEKYCVLQSKYGNINSIWDAKDKENGDNGKVFFQKTGVVLPKVKGVNLQNIPEKDIIGRDLHNAIIKKDIDLIKKILKNNPDLDFENDPMFDGSFLELAIKEGSENIIQLLLDFGADPNLDNGYLIMLAINTLLFEPLESSLNIIKLLLENGADPNVKNGFGETPLGLAQMWDNTSLVSLLKKYGAKE